MKDKRYLPNYIPHKGQQKLHESTAKETIIISSIRAGKSYSIIMDCIMKAWNNPNPDLALLVTAPTIRLLEAVLVTDIVQKLQDYGLLLSHSYNRKESILKNGNRIYYRSLENPDVSLRGLNIFAAYVDECSFCSKYSIDVVKGRLLTNNGELILVATPNGVSNWFYWDYFSTKRDDVNYITFNLRDNPIITEEAIQRLKVSYDPLLYRQEILGEFVNLYQHRVYHAFSDDNVVEDYNMTDAPVYVGADFNLNKNAWIAMQRLDNNKMIAFTEGFGATTTADMAYQILKKFPNNKIIVVPDASGGNKIQGVATTHFALMRQAGLHNIIVRSRNPLVEKRVAVSNAAFQNALGEHRTLITKNCFHTIKELNTLAYLEGTSKIDNRGEKVGHRTSALTYCMMHLTGESVGAVTTSKNDFVKKFRQQILANETYS